MRNHYFVVILLCLLGTSRQFLIGQGISQSLPKLIPPSPNAAALGKYGDIPISPYTGVPDISIPIYTVKSGNISVPISISYHASGIKVAEEAGRVGLGWVLNAGGVITRSVIGEDDFFVSPNAYHNTSTPEIPYASAFQAPVLGNTPLSFLQFGTSPAFIIPTSTVNLDAYMGSTNYDFQPDQYSYNFMGYSGKFILKRNKEVILGKQDKILIKCLDDSGNSWQVTTADGFKYIFDIFETYTDNTDNGTRTYKSAWYLTKITSPTQDVITFTYSSIANTYIKSVSSYSEKQVANTFSIGCDAAIVCTSPPNSAVVTPGKIYTNLFLSSIDFQTGSVKFVYSDDRIDVTGDKKITTVQIFDKIQTATPIKEYAFGYDYFTGNLGNTYNVNDAISSTDRLYKRLKLISLTETVTQNNITTSINPYLFTYYEGDGYTNLPAKNSFARDHWGFFNGKLANTSFVPTYSTLTGGTYSGDQDQVDFYYGYMSGQERNPDPAYMKAFTLKQIQYPTGGRTEFIYQAHDFDTKKSNLRDGSYAGLKAKSGKIPNPTLTQMFYNGNNKGTVYSTTLDLSDMYVLNGHYQQVSMNAAFRVSSTCATTTKNYNIYFRLSYLGGGVISTVDLGLSAITCSGGTSPVFTYSNTYNLPPGKYTWEAYIPSGATDYQDISAIYSYVQDLSLAQTNPNKFEYAGGLRISQVIDHDGISEVNNKIKKYIYGYTADKNNDGVVENYSYGRRMAIPQYSNYEIKAEYKDLNPGNAQYTCTQCLSLFRISDSSTPLNGSASGSVVGYDTVTVLNGTNGEYGKTVYQYANLPDTVFAYNSTLNSGAIVPVRPPLMSSMPYERNGFLIKETDYLYNSGSFTKIKEVTNVQSPIDYLVNNTRIYYGIEKRIRYTNNPAGIGGYTELFLYPAVKSDWINTVSSVSRNYEQGSVTKYGETKTEYFYDNIQHLQPTRTIQTLSNGKKIITKMLYPLDFVPADAGALVTDMQSDGRYMHNTVLQKTILEDLSGTQKVLSSQVTKLAYTAGLNSTTLILPQEEALLEAAKPLDPTNAAEFPVYKPVNGYDATKFTKRLTYDQYDTQGNIWQYHKEGDAPSTYLWGYNHTYPIAEIKNATYAEVRDALGGQAVVDAIAGSTVLSSAQITQLNNLRSNATLKKAFISTYTYKPLVGMLTATDANGLTITYIYDDLGRLKSVMDNDGYIVKNYVYNYKH